MINRMSLPAAVCLVLLAVGAGAKEGRKPDAWITTKVKTTLATHKHVRAIGTDVDTKNGYVTLKGEVGSTSEKELAGKYAREVDGVRGVNNQLKVREGARNEGVEGSGDRVLNKATGGHSGYRANERSDDRSREGIGDAAVHNMGDAALTARVKAALSRQEGTSGIHTNVDTERGSVTLHGHAKTEAERDLAEKTVRDVKGVNDVRNEIEVDQK